jgi:hypothetical protein
MDDNIRREYDQQEVQGAGRKHSRCQNKVDRSVVNMVDIASLPNGQRRMPMQDLKARVSAKVFNYVLIDTRCR